MNRNDIIPDLHESDIDALLRALDKSVLASLTDARGDILYVNDKFVQVSKYSREELMGQNHRILKSGKQPQAMFVEMWKTISSGNIWRGEIQNRAKDGSYYWVDTTIAPIIGNGGKPERYVSIRILITERKRTEDELRAQNVELGDTKLAMLNVLEDVEEEKTRAQSLMKDLEKFKLAVDSANDQVIITDENGTVLYANPAAERITGFTIPGILGKKAGSRDLWGGLMPKGFYEQMWHTIKTEKKVFAGEIKNKRKNGEEYYAKGNISPVLGANGEVEFFVAIEHDATEEKNIDKAKTEFVSLASHQLRTPLSAINWYAEMLIAGDAGSINEEQKKYLEEIYKGNQRMVDLVNALLNVSRIDLGTFQIEPEPTDVAKLLQDVIGEQKFALDARRITLSSNVQSDMPQLNADTKLFRMVFQNLLSNACKYTPVGGSVRMELKTKKKGDSYESLTLNEDSFCFSIMDSGYGIPAAQKNKIFSKLFRADNVRSMDTDGTGLGLYIVKSIIEHSGGKIWFTSEENKGTTFFFILPASGMTKKEGVRALGS